MLLFTLIFLQGNPIPARSVVDGVFEKLKTKQKNIDRSDAKGLVSRHNAPNSAMNLSPFLCFLLHICCVYGVKAINLLYHNLGDLDFNGRRQAICARV